ncbi:5'-AMP-activated protein kinase subunit gamma-1 isoform X9 [Parasteatoda tepidariorum]|uniref:5'-AMP-activated protein kinase subunit gamma-1 isoform X9 n=1 Tax=Parasteatoda tepidariorum TaxID=114398 RepID=UPI0039BCC397
MAYLNRVCSAFCNVYFYFRDWVSNTLHLALMASSEENECSTANDEQSNADGTPSDVASCSRKSSEDSDKTLDASPETTADSDNIDVSTGEENNPISEINARQEKPNYFKSFSKSAHRIFKGLKSPKGSKRPPTRPMCSSDVIFEPSKVMWPSPIRNKEENRRETSPDLHGTLPRVTKVDRIDYASLAEDKIIPTFLSSRTCYDVMPVSGKVVVLSVELLVKNAFEALVNNELRAAPLWDESISSFVGMLTISDFINVLRHYYSNSPENIKDIESQSISTWRKINRISKPVVKINATDNLAQATKLLIEEGVHRVPVLDEGGQCSFFVLTRKNLLHYLYNNIMQRFGNTIVRTPSFLSKTIRELGVGTFSDIAKVTFDTKVIEALDLFVQRKVSGLPIVDENNTLLDIFAKFDVFALAKEQTYHNLDMTINEAIDKGKVHEDVYGCTLDDTLGTVIRTIVTSKAHRLVVIDENKSVVGIVSLSDILKFLVVQPLSKLEDTGAPSTDIIEEAPEGAVGGTECDDNVFLDAKPKSCETPDEEDEQDEENSSKVKRDSVAEEEEE